MGSMVTMDSLLNDMWYWNIDKKPRFPSYCIGNGVEEVDCSTVSCPGIIQRIDYIVYSFFEQINTFLYIRLDRS